jgi:mono/diheme cytochrome c family protein
MRIRTSTLAAAFLLAGAFAFAAPAAEAADGKEIFLAQKCNLCHAVSSAGIEATTTNEKLKGPDLSSIELPDPETLAAYLKQEENLDEKKHKKKFSGSDEELKALIDWLKEQAASEG